MLTLSNRPKILLVVFSIQREGKSIFVVRHLVEWIFHLVHSHFEHN